MSTQMRSGPLEGLVAIGKGMWLTLKHLLARPDDTVQYPFERREPEPRMHGRHILNRYPDGMEKCIGCELCAGACPADAILVWGAENPPDEPVSPGERYGAVYQINMLRCIFCGLCVEACPTDAITMTTFFDFTASSRSALIYTKDELLEIPPGPERRKFGYRGEPRFLVETEVGVGHLAAGSDEPDTGGADVPVVWLPERQWREARQADA